MIGFFRGVSFVSRLIAAFHRGPYSHVAWICSDGSSIEAWYKGGVVHRPQWHDAHTPSTVIDLFQVWTSPEVRADIEARLLMLAEQGHGYDWPAIFGFPFRANLQSTRNYQCAELIMHACNYAGVPLLQRIEPYKVWPTLLSYSPLLIPAGKLVAPGKKDPRNGDGLNRVKKGVRRGNEEGLADKTEVAS